MVKLTGRRVELCEITSADLPTLWQWRNQERFMGLCSTRRNNVSLEEFEEELLRDFERDRHLQFVIRRRHGLVNVGTIYTYNFNPTDGHAFVTIFVAEEHDGRGYGPEAMALCLTYLFAEVGFYKVYLEVYDYNTSSLECIRGAGFSEEGRFKGHRKMGDKRYDLIRFAVYPSHLKSKQRISDHLTKP
ncbi:MAG TPA: GNAT family protein [Candidatus Paceibacterota bacterium]